MAHLTVTSGPLVQRSGTLAARSIGLFKTGMTVGEWRDLCRERDCDPGYLHHSPRRGYVAVK